MKFNQYIFKAKVWLYPGMAGWHFVSVPTEISEEITKEFGDLRRGWGSLPVEVKIGSVSWYTSIFPDKQSGSYLLPLKAEIRKKVKIEVDEIIELFLEIRID